MCVDVKIKMSGTHVGSHLAGRHGCKRKKKKRMGYGEWRGREEVKKKKKKYSQYTYRNTIVVKLTFKETKPTEESAVFLVKN